MKIDVFDKKGKKVEDLKLDEAVFDVVPNEDVLAQYVRVYRANQRQGTSHTKTRAEVSGGGKKPWRQKGTGRARHGSRRSPIWRHGGITHGPRAKSWRLSMPKNMIRAALISALSFKQSNSQIKVLDELKIKEPKTKIVVELLKKLKLFGKTLIVLGENDLIARKSARNIKGVTTALADNLNAYELLDNKNVLFTKTAILKMQDKLGSKGVKK